MKIKILLFIFALSFSSCAGAPKKNFKTIQYLPYSGNCHERKLPNGSYEIKCYEDNGTQDQKDWIVIRKSDYNKELDYQSKLIYSCRKWRK